jgi:hypothetical protein
MAKQLYDFIIIIMNNNELYDDFNNYLQTIDSNEATEIIKLYELVQSNNFLELVKTLNISTSQVDELKYNVREMLEHTDLSRSVLVYSSIVGFVNRIIDKEGRIKNSSIAYTTAENVKNSEYVESLGIKSFKSIVNNFTNFEAFSKDSASYSIVFTGKLANSVNKTLFYFKLFPVGQVLKDNGKMGSYDTTGLEFEIKGYGEVFKLAKYNITPNILCKLATGTFSKFEEEFFNNDLLSVEFRRTILDKLSEINSYLDVASINKISVNGSFTYNTQLWKNAGILITNPGGEILSDVITRVSALERKHIMFQLLYTLYVFEKLQISHGDLHSGNVFVLDVEPTHMCFKVEGVEYCFTTTKLVKIYDLDYGNISKDTKIKLNTTSSFKINRILNPKRHAGQYLNTHYGESEYFNKNLDICILYFLGLRVSRNSIVEKFIFLGEVDPVLDKFIRDCFPGFDENNNMSIQSTLLETLKNESDRKEASIVFNMKISGPNDIKKLQIGQEVLNMTWHKYLADVIIPLRGRMIKQQIERKDNNQLWIPDTIIIPKVDMLRHTYFDELRGSISTNVRKAPLYTLDGKIIS